MEAVAWEAGVGGRGVEGDFVGLGYDFLSVNGIPSNCLS